MLFVANIMPLAPEVLIPAAGPNDECNAWSVQVIKIVNKLITRRDLSNHAWYQAFALLEKEPTEFKVWGDFFVRFKTILTVQGLTYERGPGPGEGVIMDAGAVVVPDITFNAKPFTHEPSDRRVTKVTLYIQLLSLGG